MQPDDDLQSRLTELEVRYAEQEDTIHQLSSVVFELTQKVDILVKQMRELKQRTPPDTEAGPPRTLEDDKPPHY